MARLALVVCLAGCTEIPPKLAPPETLAPEVAQTGDATPPDAELRLSDDGHVPGLDTVTDVATPDAGDAFGPDAGTDTPEADDAGDTDTSVPTGAVHRLVRLYEPQHDGGEGPPTNLLAPQHDGGGSTWRRTAEPVVMPLVNGIIDASVIGYWPLDGADGADASDAGHHASPDGGAMSVAGVFGDDGGAVDPGTAWYQTGAEYPGPNSEGAMLLWIRAPESVEEGCLAAGYMPMRWQVLAGQVRFLVGGEHALVKTVSPGQWFHVAVIWRGGTLRFYLDGRFVDVASSDLPPSGGPFGIGDPQHGGGCVVDDVLLLDRAMSSDEVAAYVLSRAPWGSTLTPGAELDYDEVRLTAGAVPVPAELIGRRRHSDLPPALEGIIALWPLDGDTTEVIDGHPSLPGSAAPTAVRGFDGQPAGALAGQGGELLLWDDRDVALGGAFTVELWFRTGHVAPCTAGEGGPLLRAVAPPEPGASVDDLGRGWEIRLCGDVVQARLLYDEQHHTVTGTRAVTDGHWHHVAMVRDGGPVRLYVDGHPEGQPPEGEFFADFDFGKAPLTVLHARDALGQVTQPVPGAVDQILVDAFPRSHNEIHERVHPRVPALRWLADTLVEAEPGGTWPFVEYELRWGAPVEQPLGVEIPDPEGVQGPCRSLLSHCTGYVAWWRFEDDQRLVDASANRLPGELVGAPDLAPGIEGAALALDGAAQLALVPDHPSLDLVSLTIELSIRADQPTEVQTLLHKGIPYDPDVTTYQLMLLDGKARYGYETADTADYGFIHSNAIPASEWTAVRVSRESGTVDFGVGPNVQSLSLLPPPGTNQDPLALGGDWLFTASKVLAGRLDSVRLMNRALSPDEWLRSPRAVWAPGPVLTP